MSNIVYDEVPSIDLSDFISNDPIRKQKFVQDLGKAFNNIGFVAVKNHGLSDELAASLYDAVKQFFALPETTKLKYEIKDLGGQRGYTAKGKEHAKGRNIGDLKEFYHVGQEKASDLGYPANIFPQEIPEFAPATIEAFRTLERSGIQILRAIALYLGLDEFYFDNKVNSGNSILRAIHYFPLDIFSLDNPQVTNGAVRAAAHGDINLITLLMGASAEGLEILRRDGQWIPVTALKEQIVVNVGDMLERLTNKKLKSTLHRVVNPPQELLNTPRYSIPFFLHPVSDMDLSCLPSCIDENNPKQFADITAGEFLNQRLKEIGLIN